MTSLHPTLFLALAGGLVYLAGALVAVWLRWTERGETDAEVLTRLDARDETSTVRLDEPSPHRRN